MSLRIYLNEKKSSLEAQLKDKKSPKTLDAAIALAFAKSVLVIADGCGVNVEALTEPASRWVEKEKGGKKVHKKEIVAAIEMLLKAAPMRPTPVTTQAAPAIDGKLGGSIDWVYNGVTRRINSLWGKNTGNNLNFNIGVIGADNQVDETITRSVWRGDRQKNWLLSKIRITWVTSTGERKNKEMSHSSGIYVSELLKALRTMPNAAQYLNA